MAEIRCQARDCPITWRDTDACLLNFSPKGEAPFWLCRDHHPPLAKGDSRPAGWQPTIAESDAKRATGLEALNKLTPAERTLVNRNIVDTGEKPSD